MSDRRDINEGDLFLAAQARAIDARAIRQCGVDGYGLMQQAAAAALRALRAKWPAARELLVFCGTGNNGGDGYVLARDALRQGWRVRVIAITEPESLSGDAATAAKDCQQAGVMIISLAVLVREGQSLETLCHRACASADVIVDGLLGTGLKAAVREPTATVIRAINTSERPVLALDIPSGLCADTGRVLGTAVRANLTVTFIVEKAGLWLNDGPQHTGACQLAPLQIPPEALTEQPVMRRLTANRLRQSWQPRARDTHKGQAGHVIVIGGGEGMPGAARLAAQAALAVGAGRVTVLCARTGVTAIAAGAADVMVFPIDRPADAQPWLAKADVIALGPGLGLDAWAHGLFSLVIDSALPMVIDADALTLLAQHRAASGSEWGGSGTDRVLTPHPGEAARLLGTDSASVQADRWAALTNLCDRYRGVHVLKGAGSLIADGVRVPAICTLGNPAMATAGMGDVLTGVIAGLRAQGISAWEAASTGVWLHAKAGDRMASQRRMDRGLRASELAEQLPSLLGELVWGDP
jgi:hydroxyethylthiazole kinase-like uncharacterized protein yjeF